MKLCKADDCTSLVFSGGYCKKHQQMREDKKEPKDKNGQKVKESPKPILTEWAQKAFNSYIKTRDLMKGCISCGGKVTEAGHYYPVGSFTGLRFHEMNTNGQCNHCNCALYGNLDAYREGLYKRYGKSKTEQFLLTAGGRKFYKWTRDELQDVIDRYAKMKGELLKERA